MRKTVLATVVRNGLLPRGCRIVAAVSGGSDSMALLDILHTLAPSRGWSVTAAHVRYGLRGAAAGADCDLVASYCAARGIPLHVRDLSDAPHPADEAWMRQVRYAFLEEVRMTTGSDAVATGHTRDDLAETVLLHLLRGTGPAGLSGISYRRDRIVRPMLDMSHADTIAYCRHRGIAYGEDITNTDTSYLRNRVRHELLPLLTARYNPAATDALVRLAHLAADDAAALTLLAETLIPPVATENSAVTFGAAAIAALPVAVQRMALRRYLAAIGVTSATFGTVESLRRAIGSGKNRPQTVRTGALSLTRNGDTVRLAAGPRQ